MADIVDINVNKTVETVDINATPNVVQVNINSISGDVEWGEIDGTLSNQTDLKNALDLKANLTDIPDFADQTETNAGLVTDKVIAPNTLSGWWTYVKGLAQTFAQKITFTSGALFSPQVAPTYERGRVYFDDANDCISFMDSISGTSVQVGYEVLMRARNNTGTTIPNGSVVYISGAIGQNSTVALAQANTLPTSEIIGIATHDIANNTVGKICVFGLVNDFNTSSFTDGQMLYLSASVAGGLTSSIPASPNFVVALGVVEHAHPTQGKILVRPQRALANNNALGTAQNISPTQNSVKVVTDLKLDKSTTASSVYGTDGTGEQTMIPVSNFQQAIGFTPENVANKATDLSSPNNTKYPTTLAVANENKKATITVELISQLTTNFYAPSALRINATTLISGSGTLTLKVNDVAYTSGNLIPQGAKITAETTSASVYNLISVYE